MAILIGGIGSFFFGFMLFSTSVFLILLVLVQRGRGGGLTGALGGAGGQSAFGTKAGDVFTKITAICALVWFLLCVGAIAALQRDPAMAPGRDDDTVKGAGELGADPETKEPESKEP
ncbi:MAG: preprotein translocase subunit SecG, partial [Planctomycetales bacterium]|nr:preprotein translocase subunit SecG [Planctomycetales bacterium]